METVCAIELRNITKRFGSVVANDGINLALNRGEILSLLGENGSGKTPLMNMLAGIYFPDEGEILVEGKPVSIRSPKDSFQYGIGMIHQHYKLVDVFTAAENIVLGLDEGGRLDIKAANAKVKEICDRYGFDIDPTQKIYDMSVSQKQTVEIVKVLYRGADILILDEPTAGLDPIVRDEILELFNEFTRDETHSVLISSHILSDLEKLCDYIAFLHQGRLLFCEEKDALLEQYGIFNDTAEQAEALMPEAIVSMETTPYGGVRALVRRELAPVGFQLEKPTIEDIILALVKGEKQ